MPRAAIVLSVMLVVLEGASFARASRPDGWSEDTHGRDAIPDYARVFQADRVNRLDITVTADDWARVMADMTAMAGPFGAQRQPQAPGGGFGGFPQPSTEAIAACSGRVVGDSCTLPGVPNGRCTQLVNGGQLSCVAVVTAPGGGNPGGNPGGGNMGAQGGARAQGADDVDIFPRTPVYVPADVTFDGQTFRKTGFRLKGNSSLSNAWRAGVEKLPLRLNFDVLEDEFSEIRDQTFFGFPNLAFTNNGNDTSFLRHRVVTDLFREAGVPAARTAYLRIFLDRGAGPVYLGLYTMTEVPDRPMLSALFGNDDGNLYKPVGTGGRWLRFFELSFPKKTNEEDEDWTDIEDAIAVLNESRVSAAVWRARLEARFEVNGFLRWLALNTIVGNFDAYGGLSAHNYYLYGSPRHRDRLFWIAWDHDLAMSAGGIGGGGGGGAGAVDLFLNGTNSTWPLIRFLLDDPVYRAAYRAHLEDLASTVFEPSRVIARLRAEQARIAPYVNGAEGEQAGRTFLLNPGQFDASVTTVVNYVQARSAAVRQILASTR